MSEFIAAPDCSIWMQYFGFQRRLYVSGTTRASIPFEAWSGGGQTNALNRRRRVYAHEKYGSSVPTTDFPFDSFRAASINKVRVTDYRGRPNHQVSMSRGGVLPSGLWIAVFKDAAGYRRPHHPLGDFPTWWLYPLRPDWGYKNSHRGLHTFYIHVTGFLGSDGCIVMEPNNLRCLAEKLGNRPYTYLRSAVFQGTDLDGHADRSAVV